MTSPYDKNALVNALLGNSTLPNPKSEFGSLLGSIEFGSLFSPTPAPVTLSQNSLAGVLGLIGHQPASSPTNALLSLSPAFAPYSRLSDFIAPPAAPARPAPVPAPVKRKGFFSFHYADIMRVNNVRNAWKINCPGREDKRQFYDRSLWESVQRNNPAGLKNLIRGGMAHASVVCVMVGNDTWSRPWVRYEIARSVIDKKGLLAVHVNGLPHHQHRRADPHGENPLHYMGVGSPKRGIYYLYEKVLRQVVQHGQVSWEWRWEKYSEFTVPVPLPKYMPAPSEGWVTPLSGVTPIYDYVGAEGNKNIGRWIDTAALRVGR
jgi:hypothetical protein